MSKVKFRKWWIYLATIIILGVMVFINPVNFNPLYSEGAAFYSVVITIFVVETLIMNKGGISFKEKQMPNGTKAKVPVFDKKSVGKLIWIAIIPWAFTIVVGVVSSPLFNYKKYRDQMAEPQVKSFSSDVQAVDLTQIPVVDSDLAYKLADKKLGERQSLGSQVVLGTPTIQQVNGELVWVVPLNHSGFFKWLSNYSGTPGYVVVSATNPNDVRYVENFKVKYHPNSYFLTDLGRKLRFTKAPFMGFTDESFELDDSGKPYWVVSAYKNTWGFSLPEAVGVYIVDAATGETTYCKKDEVPSWVDRVQPSDFIENQIDNKGNYIRGIFNFSNRDKYKASKGEAIIYNNGNCYLFTGLTSVGQDESAIGFMMVNMVTKEAIKYDMSGATEYSAQQSAEGKVQHLGYKASFPIVVNMNNVPTYFMPLKDKEGLIKQYALVSVENYSTVGTGETIADAKREYTKALGNSGEKLDDETIGEKLEINGTVMRISSRVVDGNTVYEFILQEDNSKIYSAGSAFGQQLALTKEGDSVTLKVTKVDDNISVDEFINNTINAK